MFNALIQNQTNIDKTTSDVLKTTALYYLVEALLNEVYEDCAQLVLSAKEFGATQEDIDNVIAVCRAELVAQIEDGVFPIARFKNQND